MRICRRRRAERGAGDVGFDGGGDVEHGGDGVCAAEAGAGDGGVFAGDRGRDSGGGTRIVFAREVNDLTSLIYDAREHAIGLIRAEANAIGADDVVGIKTHI